MARNRKTWKQAFRDGLVSGTLASIASTIALAVLGKEELDKAAAPLNGPSQWIWGRQAPYQNRFSFHYTVVGYAIHHGASIFWAILHEKLRQDLPAPPNRAAAAVPAIAITAAAYAVDFHVIPKRLTPGFEHRLSRHSLLAVYGTFAIGLAAIALTKHYDKAPRPKRSNR
jgi:hypothetical protein